MLLHMLVIKKKGKKTKNNKVQKGVPDWYQEYILKQNKNKTTSQNLADDGDLEELKNFFNPNNKE